MILQPGLNSFCQRAEVANTLQLVVRQFHVEMLLQARKETQGLQAVDTQLLEEIVIGRKGLARDLELGGGQVQDFVDRLLLGSHGLYYGKYGCASVLSTNFFSAACTVGRA